MVRSPHTAGALPATKMVLNEFIAFLDMSHPATCMTGAVVGILE
jgi:nucleoside permease NupC